MTPGGDGGGSWVAQMGVEGGMGGSGCCGGEIHGYPWGGEGGGQGAMGGREVFEGGSQGALGGVSG